MEKKKKKYYTFSTLQLQDIHIFILHIYFLHFKL